MATSTTHEDVVVPSHRRAPPPPAREAPRRRSSVALLLLLLASASLVVGVITTGPGDERATPDVRSPAEPRGSDAAPGRDAEDAGPTPTPVERVDPPPTTDPDPEPEPLVVRLRLPVRILGGNVQQFELEVTTGSGRRLPDDTVLEVQIDTELDPRARGRVWIQPNALLVRPPELRTRLLGLYSSNGLPCDVRPGVLRVRVRSLTRDGALSAIEQELPVRPCGLPSAPEPAPPIDDLEFSSPLD